MSTSTSLLKRSVKTPRGIGKVEDIYITELGFLMIKVKFKDEGIRFINYNLGQAENVLKSKEIQFI